MIANSKLGDSLFVFTIVNPLVITTTIKTTTKYITGTSGINYPNSGNITTNIGKGTTDNHPDSGNITTNIGKGTTDNHEASTSICLTVGGVGGALLSIFILGIVVQRYVMKRFVFSLLEFLMPRNSIDTAPIQRVQ